VAERKMGAVADKKLQSKKVEKSPIFVNGEVFFS